MGCDINRCGYLRKGFTDNIDKGVIKTVVECGSRDCLDAISLMEYYNPNRIYAFECNPDSFLVCENNILNKDVILIKKAVCDKDGDVVFFATDMEKSVDKNIGASSLLFHLDNVRRFIQKEILVDGIRLDTFMQQENLDTIDLLVMDLQGAESMAIDGLGERVVDVRYIISEVSFRSYYVNDVLFNDMRNFMSEKGFECVFVYGRRHFGDALFVNKKWY